ncbi:uncharacterized protein LY79DRAFT_269753 [Colletotrichum navitas]|uniref:Uncharacterized protein n=1 Tax=Colletotrichum navitas TaxID=681940 RepID=A0AAD8PWW6_9PEZI|nr:uncharacterized protein LY79DRAFT_269753 [Colletotrichum navitas]KAK1585303.1 hypothetical protein LY79DRAFT_269753 [Colletotrichum navitas]
MGDCPAKAIVFGCLKHSAGEEGGIVHRCLVYQKGRASAALLPGLGYATKRKTRLRRPYLRQSCLRVVLLRLGSRGKCNRPAAVGPPCLFSKTSSPFIGSHSLEVSSCRTNDAPVEVTIELPFLQYWHIGLPFRTSKHGVYRRPMLYACQGVSLLSFLASNAPCINYHRYSPL